MTLAEKEIVRFYTGLATLHMQSLLGSLFYIHWIWIPQQILVQAHMEYDYDYQWNLYSLGELNQINWVMKVWILNYTYELQQILKKLNITTIWCGMKQECKLF